MNVNNAYDTLESIQAIVKVINIELLLLELIQGFTDRSAIFYTMLECENVPSHTNPYDVKDAL